MTPRSLIVGISLLIAIPAAAQNGCSLGMALNCSNGSCTATTTNNGTNTCTGEFIAEMLINDPQHRGTISGFQNSLGLSECFDSSTLPIGFGFAACIGDASLAPGGSFTASGQASLAGADPSTIIAITAVLDPDTRDEIGLTYVINDAAPPTCTPVLNGYASLQTDSNHNANYSLSWAKVTEPNAAYTIDESTDSTFPNSPANPTVSQHTSATSASFFHNVDQNTTYYYRVRADICNSAQGPYSKTLPVTVGPIPTITERQGDVTAPFGSTKLVSMNVFLPSPFGKQAQDVTVPFTASVDKPYLTVSPSSGTIPPGGTTVTVTADPTNLPPGANTGTLTVTSNGAPVTTKSVSVSLITPVSPSTTGLPPSNALVIPAVAHLQGAFGPFQSDVRLTNASPATISYQVKFTSGGSDPSRPIKTTTIDVDGGKTIALNDVLKDFFGVGAADPANGAGGTLEIRPLNTTSALNYAASRLFTFDGKGNTFGQFIAAIPFSQFATKATIALPGVPAATGTPTLSLQQVASSAKFRTNLGLVEGSGSPASGNIKLYNDAGQLLATIPYSLSAGEQKQSSLPGWGLPSVDDGRIEVTVESSTGAVTAYASVLDNNTQDPLEVTPVQVSQVSATRYILPGMAALNNGANNFHSDVRLYNGGSTPVTVTPTFYSLTPTNPPKPAAPLSIAPGEVKAFDDVVASLFNANGDGGSIVFTTTNASSLVATGRTYTIDPTQNNGTFGQFIPGVMPSQGVGVGDRPLQILQLEESNNFRSNLGLAELSGNAATTTCNGSPATACVHITAYVPDAKTTVSSDIPLGPNQFTQLGRVLAGFGLNQSNIYNARISVAVTGGTGRVSAYGSVIDSLSHDPTYVPAQ